MLAHRQELAVYKSFVNFFINFFIASFIDHYLDLFGGTFRESFRGSFFLILSNYVHNQILALCSLGVNSMAICS